MRLQQRRRKLYEQVMEFDRGRIMAFVRGFFEMCKSTLYGSQYHDSDVIMKQRLNGTVGVGNPAIYDKMLCQRVVIDTSPMQWHTIQLHLDSFQYIRAFLQVYHSLPDNSPASSETCRRSFVQNYPHTKIIVDSGYYGLIDTGVPVGNKFSFPMNPALICDKVVAALTLDTLPMNPTFWSALGNVTLVDFQHDGLLCYWVIWKISTANNCA